ncbi:MAG: hypothetical protein KDB20_14250 [Microthrixaceae bacterium]|nr:hypothetical protein [Microthrixaceae bacterium]
MREGGAVSESADISYTCPRCSAEVAEAYYGPCRSCRQLLRDQYAGLEQDIEAEEYAPKMNVTPNAVALKE